MKKLLAIVALAVFVCGCIGQSGMDNTPTKGVDYTKSENLVVTQGDKIAVYYTGSFVNGTVFDSNEGGNPMAFTVGSGQLISGFDKGVVGMKLNEEKTITIPPEEAYGNGDHPLANQTLVFKIKVVLINK